MGSVEKPKHPQESFVRPLFSVRRGGGTVIWSAARDARRTAELNSRLAGQLQQSQSQAQAISEAFPYDDQTPAYPPTFARTKAAS